MARRDTSPEAEARAYMDRVGARDLFVYDISAIIRAERARVRRIVRRIRRTGPMGCVAQMEREVACDRILAALREGKGTR